MKVLIQEVVCEDWKAIYINDKKVLEDHKIDIVDICDELDKLINIETFARKRINAIDSIEGYHFYLNDEYAEEYGFPECFSDIPKDAFE